MQISFPSSTDQNIIKLTLGKTKLPSANQAELIIAKHRNGSIADVRLSFHGSLAKFSDLDVFGSYHSSGFAQQDEPSGFDKLRVSIDPGAAFGLPDNGNISRSAMNDDDDDAEMPF